MAIMDASYTKYKVKQLHGGYSYFQFIRINLPGDCQMKWTLLYSLIIMSSNITSITTRQQ